MHGWRHYVILCVSSRLVSSCLVADGPCGGDWRPLLPLWDRGAGAAQFYGLHLLCGGDGDDCWLWCEATNLPRRARDECKELRSNGVYVSAGDFEALFLRDRLFASAYVLFGTIIVGFCVSVIVEVSLNLEGEERKAELHRLFKVRSPTLQLALQQQHHSIYRTYNSTYSAAHCSTLPFRTVRAHWRASSVVYQ